MTSEFSLRVTRRAHGHIRRAAEWWELNRPLAPGAVHEELDQAFALLRAHPRIGATATNAKARGIRRFHLERIHYYLYYRLRRDTVEVVALWHTSRSTGPGV
ncbi:MAG: type II toxin-antitoxin system RelE/ParE family toxin [Burkholderiales bacterium]|nr:type II toxin-antitoxin system RelE/ParE family toxin [Burkholderiales bacterium]